MQVKKQVCGNEAMIAGMDCRTFALCDGIFINHFE